MVETAVVAVSAEKMSVAKAALDEERSAIENLPDKTKHQHPLPFEPNVSMKAEDARSSETSSEESQGSVRDYFVSELPKTKLVVVLMHH